MSNPFRQQFAAIASPPEANTPVAATKPTLKERWAAAKAEAEERDRQRKLAKKQSSFLRRFFRGIWTLIRVVLVLLILMVIGGVMISTYEDYGLTPEEIAARDAQREANRVALEAREAAEREAKAAAEAEKERRKVQLKCASPWDGSIRAAEAALKDALRDPGSYEHIQTMIGSVKGNGTQRFVMRYRARNGFGGMTIGQVNGGIRHADCSLLDWRVVE